MQLYRRLPNRLNDPWWQNLCRMKSADPTGVYLGLYSGVGKSLSIKMPDGESYTANVEAFYVFKAEEEEVKNLDGWK